MPHPQKQKQKQKEENLWLLLTSFTQFAVAWTFTRIFLLPA
jgi:hypothetical protein